MNVYQVIYRRSVISTRKYRMRVHANSADEARVKAGIADPQLSSTVRVKNCGEVREFVGEAPGG